MIALDLVSTKQLAAETGLDARTCRTHALAAGLHEYEGRRFDHGAALDAIRKAVEPHRVVGHAAGARGNVAVVGAGELAAAKARAEVARAEKLERANAIEAGHLIARASVEKAITDIVARARTHFLGMGPRVAARLAGMEDEQAIIALLDAEARITLRELARLDDLHAAVLA